MLAHSSIIVSESPSYRTFVVTAKQSYMSEVEIQSPSPVPSISGPGIYVARCSEPRISSKIHASISETHHSKTGVDSYSMVREISRKIFEMSDIPRRYASMHIDIIIPNIMNVIIIGRVLWKYMVMTTTLHRFILD